MPAPEQSTPTTPPHFADRLMARIRAIGHPLCLGLDPHLDRIPPLFRPTTTPLHHPDTARHVETFLRAVLERYCGQVAAVKPQVAFFEQLGARGMAVLERVIGWARQLGMTVILDGKRGDIESTAQAYAQCLVPTSPLYCDAVTVHPYLGRDSVAPFLQAANAHGGGVFVLVKTSNPGAADFQDLDVAGQRVFERVAIAFGDWCERLRGGCGWSALGAVVGASHTQDAVRIRELLPHALFLVPGIGAQGADVPAALAGFVRGAHGLEGGLVTASRALLFPPGSDTNAATSWQRAIDAARDRMIAALQRAMHA